MNLKITSLLVLPTLFSITGIVSYFTLKNNWNFEIASLSIFIFTLVYILIVERIIPLKQEWKSSKLSLWADIKHLIFSVAIFDALGKMAALSLITCIQEYYFLEFNIWNSFPFLIPFIFANLIGEFIPYLYHKISHEGNPNSHLSLFLWRIHSIHHLPKKLNWYKTNWIHPINMFLNTFLKILPLLFFGFGKDVIFLVGITHIIIAYISHANIQTQKSFWDYLVVTPHIHHFHHSTKMEEAKNFGNTFPFWDLVFGTYYNRKGAVKQVGVVENGKTHYPKDQEYINQLKFPFSAVNNCCK